MLKTFAFSLMTLAMVSGSALFAQTAVVSSGADPYSGWGQLRYHSSTAAEGFQRGQAAVIDAAGSYNANTAQAMISYEQARALALENDKMAVQTYFHKQEMNNQYRAAMRGPRPTMEQLIRRAKEAAPDRLNKYELDPVFGTVRWPAALQGSEFAAYRAEIEKSFRDRDIINSGVGSEVQRTVAHSTELMQSELKAMIHAFSPAEYVQAKRFLQSLAYEAEHSPQIQGVAAISP